MRKRATLVLNPAAAGVAAFRAQWPAMEGLLRARGYAPELVETTPEEGSAQRLAAASVVCGAAIVLACGGDGTVHEVVQGLAETEVALGIIPLGTANALARNLGLPLDPGAAVLANLVRQPERIALGQAETSAGKRWFCLMAGCGPDGALIHELSREGGLKLKRRFGRMAYYGHAGRLFLTRRWPLFRVEWRESEQSGWQHRSAVAMMAPRVPDLGGAFGAAALGTLLMGDRLRVQVVAAPAWLSMPAWMVCGRLGFANPWVRSVEAIEVRCTALAGRPVMAQADAEPVGPLPMTLRVVPNALSLLMPPA